MQVSRQIIVSAVNLMPTSRTPVFVRLQASGSPGLGLLRALGVVALCTAISEVMALNSDLADILMVYLAGVVYVALHESLRTSIATVIASVFMFDLAFVPPRWGLNPLHPSHLFTLAVMLVVGLLISRLSALALEQTALAERRAERAQALSDLASRLASARSLPDIEATVSEATRAMIGVDFSLASGAGRREGNPLSPEEEELIEAFAGRPGWLPSAAYSSTAAPRHWSQQSRNGCAARCSPGFHMISAHRSRRSSDPPRRCWSRTPGSIRACNKRWWRASWLRRGG